MRKKEIYLLKISKLFFFFPFEIAWTDLNISKISILHQIFLFLKNNYIEDIDSIFRFNYVHEFLSIIIKNPNWCSFFNLGIKFYRGKKLIGFISSNSKLIIFNNFLINVAEINYLCLLKKIRNKCVVSTLIREITRRLNLFGIIQAIYTTSICFFKSLLICPYFHYPINISKLLNCEFMKNSNSAKNLKINYKILKKNLNYEIKNLTWYQPIRKHLINFKAYYCFNKKKFFYWFKTIPGVFYLYLFFEKKDKKKPKILSFYSLSNKIIKRNKKNFLYTAYWFFGFLKFPFKKFYPKFLEIAFKLGFDLLNILESHSENKKMLKLNFLKGTGRIQFHIFNWNYNKRIFVKDNALVFF